MSYQPDVVSKSDAQKQQYVVLGSILQITEVTIEGDKKTEWICGCFQTADNYFKFCNSHNQTLQKAIQAQIDELDMTQIIEE